MHIFIIILIFNLFYPNEFIFISGTVLDNKNDPIANVIIASNDGNFTRTNREGYFMISVDTIGPQDISFKHIAYKNKTITLDSRTKDLKIIVLDQNFLTNDEIVVTSRRKETKIKDSPILIHIINESEIKETSYSNIEELIEFAMPNVQAVNDNHGMQDIKIQGLNSKYIMFLVDGRKISSEFAGNIDFSSFNVNNIDRIEIVRGGLSTVYGSGAMGGVVNIITKNANNPIWLSYNSFYDSPKQFSNAFNFGFNQKKITYCFSIVHKNSKGYDLTKDDFNSGATFEINKTQEEFQSINFESNIKYSLNKSSFLNIDYKNYFKNINKYEFISNNTYLQPELPKFRQEMLSLSYNKIFKNKSSILIFYQIENHRKSYYFPYYYSSLPSTANLNPEMDGKTILWSKPITNNTSIIYNWDYNNHSILTGIERLDQSYSSYNIYSNNGSLQIRSIFDQDKSKFSRDISFFILDNYKSKNFPEIDYGIRLNHNSKYNFKLSPSFSVKNTIKNYIYRLNYSQSYRSPSLKELYYSFGDHPGGFPIIGNNKLKPSTSSYYSFSIESLKRRSNSLELYFNNVTNMIANRFEEFSDSDPTIVYKYHNYKNVNLYGFHLNILFFPTDKTEFRSTYSFTDSNSDYDDIQDGISKHSLNLEFKYKLNDLSRIIFSTKYNSNKTIDVSLEDANNQRTEIILPQYYIVNLSYFKSFNSKNYIKFGVKNLFDYIDENPSAPDFLASYDPGRRFYISLNFSLYKNKNE